MAVPYEKLVAEDLNSGYGSVAVTMPAGGTATGSKIGLHTFMTVLNVRDFGARGDGATDDTAAIQATLDRLTALGGGTAFFPQGTYLVRPAASGGVILTLGSTNLRLTGQGVGQATIKVAASSGPYRAILQGTTVNTDLSNLTVDCLTFDHNVANNALPNTASIVANPEFTIAVFAGTDITFDHLQIKNASSLNNLVANGVTVARVTITHCVFTMIGDDPNHVVHDASLIYTSGPQVVIAHNQFISAGPDSGGATTAIETHSSSVVIADNVIVDFWIGMNITGIESSESHGITVTGNTITGGCLGIRLWSAPYLTHTTGFGLNGVTVTGNIVRLGGNIAWPTKSPGGEEQGIGLTTLNDNLDATGIVIANNLITYPLELVGLAHSSSSLGIGWLPFDAKTLSNSKITGNTIINFPMAGIRLSCKLSNVDVAGNTLINCGSTLSTAAPGTTAYRIPFFLGATTIAGLTVRSNIFVDSLSEITWRPAYFIYLFQDGTTVASGVELTDNTFVSTGSAMTQAILLATAGGTLLPSLRGSIPNFVPTTGPNQKWRKGSCVLDPVIGTQYVIREDQFTWLDGLLSTSKKVRAMRYHSAGTPLVAGDIALNGWGAGASVTVAGTDQCPIIIVTAGAGPSALPTVTLTWHDGTWTSAPVCLAQMVSGSGTIQALRAASNAATLALEYQGTPVNGFTYQFNALLIGIPG